MVHGTAGRGVQEEACADGRADGGAKCGGRVEGAALRRRKARWGCVLACLVAASAAPEVAGAASAAVTAGGGAAAAPVKVAKVRGQGTAQFETWINKIVEDKGVDQYANVQDEREHAAAPRLQRCAYIHRQPQHPPSRHTCMLWGTPAPRMRRRPPISAARCLPPLPRHHLTPPPSPPPSTSLQSTLPTITSRRRGLQSSTSTRQRVTRAATATTRLVPSTP